MKNHLKLAGLTMCLALTGPGMVQADRHDGDGRHDGRHGAAQMRLGFDEIDTDGDGRITPDEMAGRMQARFEGADSNGDGLLSHEELVTRMMERRAERMGAYADHMIDRHDADDDGQLGPQEMQGHRSGTMMDRIDADGDGAVSRAELDAWHSERADRHHGMKGHHADE
jgi:Ca2+-binding EF-hand superfamily protein